MRGAVEAAGTTLGEVVTTILTTAVKDVVGALGGLASEVDELREAARRAAVEHPRPDLHAVRDLHDPDDLYDGA